MHLCRKFGSLISPCHSWMGSGNTENSFSLATSFRTVLFPARYYPPHGWRIFEVNGFLAPTFNNYWWVEEFILYLGILNKLSPRASFAHVRWFLWPKHYSKVKHKMGNMKFCLLLYDSMQLWFTYLVSSLTRPLKNLIRLYQFYLISGKNIEVGKAPHRSVRLEWFY